MISEFELIRRCFLRPTHHTVLGIGDDAALIAPTPGQQLVVSTDMLVEGTHFFSDADPENLGWKTLAVNLSDLAAMGAQPRWATLAVAVPSPDLEWLDAFARGFFTCADQFGVNLVGGDTTRGPKGATTFCVTILGESPPDAALRRSGAGVGDSIWVSGMPGQAALGLAHLRGTVVLAAPQLRDCLSALHRPQPRIALGLNLRGLATAAIDVSDGLLADLGHILDASSLSAELYIPDLPPVGIARDALLAGGDDYELVFTTPSGSDHQVKELSARLALPLTRIGTVCLTPEGNRAGWIKLCEDSDSFDTKPDINIAPVRRGYDHFDTHGTTTSSPR